VVWQQGHLGNVFTYCDSTGAFDPSLPVTEALADGLGGRGLRPFAA